MANAFDTRRKRPDTGVVSKNIGRVLDLIGVDHEWDSDIPYGTAAKNSAEAIGHLVQAFSPVETVPSETETVLLRSGQRVPKINAFKFKTPDVVQGWHDANLRIMNGTPENTDGLIATAPAFGVGAMGAAIDDALAARAVAAAKPKPHVAPEPVVAAEAPPPANAFANYNRSRWAKSGATGSSSRAPDGAEFYYDHDAHHVQFSKRKALEDGADALFDENGRTVASNDVTPVPAAAPELREPLDPALFHRRFKPNPADPNPDHVYNFERIGRRIADGVEPAQLTMPIELAERPPGVRLSANADEKPALLAAAEAASGDGGNAFARGGRGPRSQNDQTPFYGEHVGPRGQLIDDPKVLAERYGLETGLPGDATNEGRFNPTTAALLQRGVQPKQTSTYYLKQLQGRGGVPPGGILDQALKDLGVTDPAQVISRDDLVRAIEQRSPRLATGRTVSAAERKARDDALFEATQAAERAHAAANRAHGDQPGEKWKEFNEAVKRRDELRDQFDGVRENRWQDYATKSDELDQATDSRSPNYFEKAIGYKNPPERWVLDSEELYGPLSGGELKNVGSLRSENLEPRFVVNANEARNAFMEHVAPGDAVNELRRRVGSLQASVDRARAMGDQPGVLWQDLKINKEALAIAERHAPHIRDTWANRDYTKGTPGIFRDGHFEADSRFASKQPERTNLEGWQRGQRVDLERPMTPDEERVFNQQSHGYEGAWARYREAENRTERFLSSTKAESQRNAAEFAQDWKERIARAQRSGESLNRIASMRAQARHEIGAFTGRTAEQQAKFLELQNAQDALHREVMAMPKPKVPTVNHFLVDEAQDQRSRMYAKNKGGTQEEMIATESARDAAVTENKAAQATAHEFIASPEFESAAKLARELAEDGNPGWAEDFDADLELYRNSLRDRSQHDASAQQVLDQLGTIDDVMGDLWDEMGDAASGAPFRKAKDIVKRLMDSRNAISDANSRLNALRNGTPPSPYVHAKSDSTHLLANEAVRDATRFDSEAITWVPGDENAVRMSIANVARGLRYNPMTGELRIGMPDGGFRSINKNPKELGDVIGEELAAELLSKPPTQAPIGQWHDLTFDQNTVIGGRGMNAFYGNERGLDRDGRMALYPGQLTKILRRMDPNADLTIRPQDMDGFRTKHSREFPSVRLSEEAKRKAREIGLRLFSNADALPAILGAAEASAQNPNAFARR